jgi:hypothetical protein
MASKKPKYVFLNKGTGKYKVLNSLSGVSRAVNTALKDGHIVEELECYQLGKPLEIKQRVSVVLKA